MPPTQSALDPQIVNLAQSIRQVESGNDPTAQGASGEYGAYQWEPSTWSAQSQAAGVDVPLKQATLEQQNEVAYKTLAGWKQQHPDWNIGNFASAWNAGEGNPDAYQNGNKGTNSSGVAYNTPAYAKKVADTYQQIKSQSLPQAPTSNLASDTIQPSSAGLSSMPNAAMPGQSQGATPGLPNMPSAAPVQPSTQPQTPPTAPGTDPSGGFLSGLQEDLNGSNPNSIGTQLENTAKGVGNFLLPSIGDTYNDLTGQNKKTALQQFGDAGSTLLGIASVIPGLDAVADPLEVARGADIAAEGASKAAPGLLSAVGKNAALGAGFGVSGALGQGKTNVGDIATSGLIGAGTGGVLGGVGELAGGALSKEAGKTGEANLREFTTVRKTLNKALTDNAKNGTDPISTLAQSGLIKDLKVTQGKLDADALTNGNGTGKLDSLIEGHSQDASQLVKELSKQPGIPLDQFKASAEADIKNDPSIRGSLTIPKALSVLDSKLESARISYGDTLPFDAIDEIRKGMNSVYDPNDRDAARVIGDTARNFLYHGDETNAALKSAMGNESELIRARNYVQKLHGTAMGKGMQKIAHEIIGSGIGGAIGSMGGPVTGGIGAMATGAATKMAEDAISSNKFDPLGAKVAQGLLNISKKPLAQVAGRATKAGILRGVSAI